MESPRGRARAVLVVATLLASVTAWVAAPDDGAAADDRLFRLTVLHFGAGESAVLPVDGVGGLDRFAELVRRQHTEAEQLGGDVVVGLGDHFVDGPQFAATREDDAAPLDAEGLSRLPVDAFAVGDRDLRYGSDVLADFVAGVGEGPTFVSANVDARADDHLGPLVADGSLAPSTVVTRWGRAVGVVGATAPSAVTGADVQVASAVVARTQTEIDRLRAGGVDIIVLAAHMGSLTADRALVARLQGVDVAVAGGGDDVLAGATDRLAPGDDLRIAGSYPLLQPDAEGRAVPVASVSGRYRYLGRIVAWFDADGDLVRLDPSSDPLLVAGADLGADRVVSRRVVDETRARVAAQPVTPLAVSQVELDGVRSVVRTGESNLGNLVADAVLHAAATSIAATRGPAPEVALLSSRAVGFDEVVTPGPFTVTDSFAMAGDQAVLVSPEMAAARLRRVLEFAVARAEDVGPDWVQVAGLRMEIDLDRRSLVMGDDGSVQRSGRRVRSLVLDDGTVLVSDGRLVDDRRVRVAIDESLLAAGHPLGFDRAQATPVTTTVRQALVRYLVDELGGAIGARQYPEGGEGRIVRPELPPRS